MAWLKTNQKQYKNEQKRIDEYMDYKTEKALKAHKESPVLDHPNGSVTDEKIGVRTVINASADSGNFTGRFSAIINNIANAIRSIRASFNTHKNNSYIHITDEDRQNWNNNIDKTAEVEENLEKAIEEQRVYVDAQDSSVLTAANNFTNARVKEVKQTLDQNIASVQENLDQANNEIANIKTETAEIGDDVETNIDKLNSLKYYGDMNIVPSDASLFFFKTDDETMTAKVSAKTYDISGDIVIPYQYIVSDKVYLVTEVENTRYIGGYPSCFQNCSNITSIIVPNSVTTVGSFANCIGLRSFAMVENSTCEEIKSDYLHFSGCSLLEKVVLPKGITKLHGNIFSNCTSLKNITLPDTINVIGTQAFYGCTSLTDITLPDSVVETEGQVFVNCINLETVVLSKNLNATGASNFYNCNKLINVNLSESLTSISDNTFMYTNIENIVLQNGITSIGTKAFASCENLIAITIPTSVTTIATTAFLNSPNLIDIYYEGTKEQWNSINFEVHEFCSASNITNGRTIHYNWVPAMKGEVDTLASQVKQANTETAEACDSIENLKSLHYYGNLSRSQHYGYLDESQFTFGFISGGAYINNVSKDVLGEVVIPSEVKYTYGDGDTVTCKIIAIGNSSSPTAEGAFKNCTGISKVYMPKYIKCITCCSFQGCSSLKTIYIPARVDEILANAFLGCDSLKYVYYGGTEAQWKKINIDTGNDMLKNAQINFCSSGCDEDYIINLIGDLEESCATKEEVEDAISPLQANWENMIEAVSANERNIGSHGDRITALETSIGDIDTALDNIIAIQNTLIGGDSV